MICSNRVYSGPGVPVNAGQGTLRIPLPPRSRRLKDAGSLAFLTSECAPSAVCAGETLEKFS